jgi:hypothetical protein
MFIFLIAYRARGIQAFRKDQLTALIKNIYTFFVAHQLYFKIVVCEQNDDAKFNRGKLLNAAFLESEKLFTMPKKYFHMNTDYMFDLKRSFPKELLTFETGFIDLHRPPYDVLGAACVFDPESYKSINGFPNDLIGWGGDDWAIYNRLRKQSIPIYYPENLTNSGFIIENNDDKRVTDTSDNLENMRLAKRNDISTNGLSTCCYTVSKQLGEFQHQDVIFHLRIHF